MRDSDCTAHDQARCTDGYYEITCMNDNTAYGLAGQLSADASLYQEIN